MMTEWEDRRFAIVKVGGHSELLCTATKRQRQDPDMGAQEEVVRGGEVAALDPEQGLMTRMGM